VGASKHQPPDHGGEFMGPEVAAKLDELHLRKIDLADYVFVLNIDGYIGESTRREIEYANATGKPVVYLEDLPSNDRLSVAVKGK
jgi:nucleoside 2-deoxyribosyltransferase